MAMVTGKQVQRFDVWLVTLEPTKGSEIQKTRASGKKKSQQNLND